MWISLFSDGRWWRYLSEVLRQETVTVEHPLWVAYALHHARVQNGEDAGRTRKERKRPGVISGSLSLWNHFCACFVTMCDKHLNRVVGL